MDGDTFFCMIFNPNVNFQGIADNILYNLDDYTSLVRLRKVCRAVDEYLRSRSGEIEVKVFKRKCTEQWRNRIPRSSETEAVRREIKLDRGTEDPEVLSEYPTSCLAFSQDETRIAVGQMNQILLYDTQTCELLFKYVYRNDEIDQSREEFSEARRYRERTDTVYSLALATDRDSGHLAVFAGTTRGKLIIWIPEINVSVVRQIFGYEPKLKTLVQPSPRIQNTYQDDSPYLIIGHSAGQKDYGCLAVRKIDVFDKLSADQIPDEKTAMSCLPVVFSVSEGMGSVVDFDMNRSYCVIVEWKGSMHGVDMGEASVYHSMDKDKASAFIGSPKEGIGAKFLGNITQAKFMDQPWNGNKFVTSDIDSKVMIWEILPSCEIRCLNSVSIFSGTNPKSPVAKLAVSYPGIMASTTHVGAHLIDTRRLLTEANKENLNRPTTILREFESHRFQSLTPIAVGFTKCAFVQRIDDLIIFDVWAES